MTVIEKQPADPRGFPAGLLQLLERWWAFVWVWMELLERDRRFERDGDDGDLVLRVSYRFGKRLNRPKVTSEIHHRGSPKKAS